MRESMEEKPEVMGDPSIMLEEFKDIVDETGFVKFSEDGAQREPASFSMQAEQLERLYNKIEDHPNISDEEKKDVAERFVKAKGYLEESLESGRYH